MNKFFIIGIIVIGIVALAGAAFYFSGNNTDSSATLKADKNTTHMTPSDFQNALSTGEYKLIDVRTAEEYAAGHIAGAEQIDFYQTQAFSDYLDSLDKNQKYLVYCRSGNRSGQALNIMQSKGFTNVSDLAGGISAWTGAGLPIEH